MIPTTRTQFPEDGRLARVPALGGSERKEVQERDGLGDRLPSDYLIRVQEGGFYGWPCAYIRQTPPARICHVGARQGRGHDNCPSSSVIDLVFYDADQFPAAYRGSAFVALKGSWNRSVPTGYKVVRVPFKDGKPEGYYENFATGFWASGERRAEVWGRAGSAGDYRRWGVAGPRMIPQGRSGGSPTPAIANVLIAAESRACENRKLTAKIRSRNP